MDVELRQILPDGTGQIFRAHVVVAGSRRHNRDDFPICFRQRQVAHQFFHVDGLFTALAAFDDFDPSGDQTVRAPQAEIRMEYRPRIPR